MVAAEDKNFWHEGGISPTGILRAAYYDLTSSGGNLQGASTITQQLVRNYYANIGTAQTMSRKVKEIFVAQKLAQTTSKEQILKEYLNTVYFGHQAYGVGAAALYYFGLPASQINRITPSQAAMIAAMIQSPSYYSPDPKAGVPYQALVARWHYVINAMVGMGTLSPQDAAKAKFPTVVKPFNNSWGGYRGYIMQAVLNELEQTYGYTPEQLNTKGLHIVTTFSKPLMDSLYATVNQNRALMKAGTPPALASGSTVACGASGLPAGLRPRRRGAREPGERRDPRHVRRAELQQDPVRQRAPVPQPGRLLVQAVRARDRGEAGHERPDEPAQRVLAAVDPAGLHADDLRQPAAGARDHDASSYFEVQNDEVSNPNRPVSVVEATAMSLNTAYADLWHRVAVNNPNGARQCHQHGQGLRGGRERRPPTAGAACRRMQDEAGIALGQASLTVEEQATMIATLADGGTYHTPHVIKDIIVGDATTPAKINQREVLTPDEAAEVDYAMSFDMGSLGTANGLGLTNGQTVIAKTGTTNLSQSAFFLGATPRYAMAVGMFVNKPGPLPASEQASAPPRRPWPSRRRRACRRCSASGASPVTAASGRPSSGTTTS